MQFQKHSFYLRFIYNTIPECSAFNSIVAAKILFIWISDVWISVLPLSERGERAHHVCSLLRHWKVYPVIRLHTANLVMLYESMLGLVDLHRLFAPVVSEKSDWLTASEQFLTQCHCNHTSGEKFSALKLKRKHLLSSQMFSLMGQLLQRGHIQVQFKLHNRRLKVLTEDCEP